MEVWYGVVSFILEYRSCILVQLIIYNIPDYFQNLKTPAIDVTTSHYKHDSSEKCHLEKSVELFDMHTLNLEVKQHCILVSYVYTIDQSL